MTTFMPRIRSLYSALITPVSEICFAIRYKADVRDHGETALQGYLGIVQAVTMPQAKRGFMGLFGGPAAVPPVNLWVTRIGRIYIENEALVIAGEAEASS